MVSSFRGGLLNYKILQLFEELFGDKISIDFVGKDHELFIIASDLIHIYIYVI